MRMTSISAGFGLMLLAGMGSAQAQSADKGPAAQNSAAMSAADQSDMSKMPIRQQIQDQMSKAGYTDVTVTPSSFYVHAKDKQGNPIAMVIGPDSVTEVTELPAAKGGGSAGTASKP